MFREALANNGLGHPVRSYFSALVVFVLIPGLCVAGWLAYRSAQSERAQIEQDARQRVLEIAAAIDHEIVATKNLLAVLSTAHLLRVGDLEGFHREAVEISRQLNVRIVLHQAAGPQLLDSSLPWGTSLPKDSPVEMRVDEETSLRTGHPVVSNVFSTPSGRQQMVRVICPVTYRPGQVLAISLPLSTFGQILNRLQVDPDRVASVSDRNRVIIARSQKHDQFAGTPIKTAGSHQVDDDVVQVISRDGIGYHWFRVHSPISSWRIAIGVADHVLHAPAKFSIVTFAIAGTALLLLAVAIAVFLGGRLSRGIALLETSLATARRRGREQFQLLFEAAPIGMVTSDSTGNIVRVNTELERLFGYSRDELIGEPLQILLPKRLQRASPTLRNLLGNDPEAPVMGTGRNLIGLRKDGKEFPLEAGLNPIDSSNGPIAIVTVVDISERRQAEAERDDLRRRIVQSQEQERLRLAQELHDRTGQELSAAMLELKQIEGFVDAARQDRIRQLRQRLEQMGKSLHQVAWELRPASFDELGVVSALAAYIDDWSAQYRVATDFHCRVNWIDEISDEVRTTIYRIVQEALTNVAKHAPDAQSVGIVIDHSDAMLQLTIEDDGNGYDIASQSSTGKRRYGGLGHAGMRERLALIGGQIEIETSPGCGTTIFVRIPHGAGEVAA